MKEYNIASIPSIYANRIEPRKNQQQQQTLAPTFAIFSLPVSLTGLQELRKACDSGCFPRPFPEIKRGK